MTLETVWCPVRQDHVSRTVNFAGEVVHVICPDCDAQTGFCRRRTSDRNDGPLGQLLDRVSEATLADATTNCVLKVRAPQP